MNNTRNDPTTSAARHVMWAQRTSGIVISAVVLGVSAVAGCGDAGVPGESAQRGGGGEIAPNHTAAQAVTESACNASIGREDIGQASQASIPGDSCRQVWNEVGEMGCDAIEAVCDASEAVTVGETMIPCTLATPIACGLSTIAALVGSGLCQP